MEIKAKVDASGLSCPLPILKASQAIKTVGSGELVEIIATDPGSVKDFAAWATSTGNALVEQSADGGKFRFVLRRK
jgi:tRNA 2-thiouridine synthesizing protein A